MPIPFNPKRIRTRTPPNWSKKTIEIQWTLMMKNQTSSNKSTGLLREPHEDPETFAKWHVQVQELIAAKKATTLASQLAAAKALLAGPALELFQAATLAVDAGKHRSPTSFQVDRRTTVGENFRAHGAQCLPHGQRLHQAAHLPTLRYAHGEKFRAREYVRRSNS